MPLAWDPQAQISNRQRQLRILKLSKTRRPYSAFEAAESVSCIRQCAFNCSPGAVERGRRHNEGHVILQAFVNSRGTRSSDLERANSSPSTNMTCIAREPCHLPLVVLSTGQNFVPQGSHCAAQIAASCGHAALAASPLEEPFNVLLNRAAFCQLHEHLRRRNRTKLTRAWLWHLLRLLAHVPIVVMLVRCVLQKWQQRRQ